MALERRHIAMDTHCAGLRCNDGALGMPMKYFFDAIDYVTGIEDGLTHRSGYERQLSAAHTTTVGLSAPRLRRSQRFSVTTIISSKCSRSPVGQSKFGSGDTIPGTNFVSSARLRAGACVARTGPDG